MHSLTGASADIRAGRTYFQACLGPRSSRWWNTRPQPGIEPRQLGGAGQPVDRRRRGTSAGLLRGLVGPPGPHSTTAGFFCPHGPAWVDCVTITRGNGRLTVTPGERRASPPSAPPVPRVSTCRRDKTQQSLLAFCLH